MKAKPHVWRRSWYWCCKRIGTSDIMGCGYTPKEAYQSWFALSGRWAA